MVAILFRGGPMRSFLVLLSALALTACSSGGGGSSKPAAGGGGVVTEFGKKMEGEWTSDCMTGDEGPYKETLSINANGTGKSAITLYPTQNCAGAARETQGPTEFTYSVEELADGSARLTLANQGQTSELTVSILGNVMDVQGQNGKARYVRSQTAQVPVTPSQDDFDRLAIGSWMSEQCFPYQNNTSARHQLNIVGRGSANLVIQVYQNSNCSGRSRAERPQTTNYKVENFSNGRGQITVNGETSEISFEGARNERMNLVDANGTIVYNKVN